MGELVRIIDQQALALPEMQRGCVWRSTRIRDFLDSIYRAALSRGRHAARVKFEARNETGPRSTTVQHPSSMKPRAPRSLHQSQGESNVLWCSRGAGAQRRALRYAGSNIRRRTSTLMKTQNNRWEES